MQFASSKQALLRRAALYADVVRALGRTAARRAMRQRAHPDWSLSYELAMTALDVAAKRHYPVSSLLARTQSAPVPRALADRVVVRRGTLAGLEIETHTPIGHRAGDATLLYFHGGGYVTCSPASHRDVIARLAHATGARCIAPDYRLAPRDPFPAALDDALACYRALRDEGVAASNLYVCGDSAGGGLALALLLRLRDAGEPLPRKVGLLSPWVDLSLEGDNLHAQAPRDYLGAERLVENARDYAGSTPRTHPLVSPALADLTGLPPILMFTGEWELLREQNERLARRAREAGVAVHHEIAPAMLHAFACFAGITREGGKAIEAIGRAMRIPRD